MKKVLGITAVLMLALMVMGATAVFAVPIMQSDDDLNQPEPPDKGALAELFDADEVKTIIAETLGVTVEEVEAALAERGGLVALAAEQEVELAEVEAAVQAYRAEVIAQALEDGLITEEQAAFLTERGGFFGGGSGFRGGPGHHGQGPGFGAGIIDREVIQETIAEALGLSVDEFEAALADGTRLPELAAEQGVELADVETAVQAAREAMINQALEDGLITEEQAERMLEQDGFCSGQSGPGRGRHGGSGGPGGSFPGPGGGPGNGNGGNGAGFFNSTGSGA